VSFVRTEAANLDQRQAALSNTEIGKLSVILPACPFPAVADRRMRLAKPLDAASMCGGPQGADHAPQMTCFLPAPVGADDGRHPSIGKRNVRPDKICTAGWRMRKASPSDPTRAQPPAFNSAHHNGKEPTH